MTTKPAPQHTPTPWALDRPNYPGIYIETVNKDLGYVRIAQMLPINAGENAAFIVKAVNAYESDQKKIKALVEAAKLAQEYLSEINYDGAITPSSFALTKEKLRNAIQQTESV